MLGTCSNEGSWDVECPVILYTYVAVAVSSFFFFPLLLWPMLWSQWPSTSYQPFWEVTLVQTICCVVGQPNSSRDLPPNITSYMVRQL